MTARIRATDAPTAGPIMVARGTECGGGGMCETGGGPYVGAAIWMVLATVTVDRSGILNDKRLSSNGDLNLHDKVTLQKELWNF